MKKLLSALLALALLSPVFVSCNDKDDKNDDNNNGGSITVDPPAEVGQYDDYSYSELTPEQQKTKLADDAKTVIEKFKPLASASGLELLKSFNSLVETSEPEIMNGSSSIIYIKDFYGKYTWNSSKQVWDKSASSDKLIFVLPAKKGTNNNGEIIITGEASGNSVSEDGTTVELPKSLKAELKVDGKNVGMLEVSGTDVNAENVPTKATIGLSLDNYKFTISFEKGTKSKASMKLTSGSDVLLESNVNFDGNLDEIVTDEAESLGEGNFEVIAIGNLAIIGNIDFDNLDMSEDDDNNSINQPGVLYDKAYDIARGEAKIAEAQESANNWNEYAEIYLVSKKDKVKIAQLKQKVGYKTYSYNGCVKYDWVNTEGWQYLDCVQEGERVDYDVWQEESLLFLKDNTEASFDAYFETGFDTVITAWKNLVKEFDKLLD